MMHLVYYPSREALVKFLLESDEQTLIITPHPAKADGIREQVKGKLTIDVITIYKFLTDLNKQLMIDEEPLSYKRKSEILMLATLLKKNVPEINFEIFKNAYQVFSDLRSYSLDKNVMRSILDDFDPRIHQIVTLLWQVMEALGFHDEHSFTHELALRVSEMEETEVQKRYVFFGFQHMSGPQVDLLKSLAIRSEVIIPQPKSISSQYKPSDWITWLGIQPAQEKYLEGEREIVSMRWIPINHREVTKNLKPNLSPGDQIILGQKRLEPLSYQLIPSDLVDFKIPYSLLEDKIKEVFLLLTKKKYSFDELEHEFQLMTETADLQRKKVIQLARENIMKLKELTDEHLEIDQVTLAALYESILLDQPRTSLVNVSAEKAEYALYDLSSLDRVDRTKRIILCIDERFGDISHSAQPYSENLMQKLAAIGPIKRSSLESLYIKDDYLDLVADQESLLLMPSDILKHHLGWRNFFEQVELTSEVQETQRFHRRFSPLRVEKDKLVPVKLSASKIQTYIDCPQKFYFSFIDPLMTEEKFSTDFTEAQTGELVHALIEICLKNKSSLDSIIDQEMIKFAKKMNIQLSRRAYHLRRTIIFNRSTNGLAFIERIQDRFLFTQFQVEREFHYEGLKGRIDFFAESNTQFFLMDFKSSIGGIASVEELRSFTKVQLWIYLASQFQLGKKATIGYLVLENPDDSIFVTEDEEVYEFLKKEKLARVTLMSDLSSGQLEAFKHQLKELIHNISQDQSFVVKPRAASVCTYCPVDFLCARGEVNE